MLIQKINFILILKSIYDAGVETPDSNLDFDLFGVKMTPDISG